MKSTTTPDKGQTDSYESRPTKRLRRSKADINRIRDAMAALLEAEQPMTVRQVFYRMVSKGIIGKSEADYKSTVVRLLGLMRRDGTLPFDYIADNTRWQRKPRTYSSLDQMLRHTQQTYRRALWDNQESYVEIWLEKDALAGVVYEVTEPWDVPLMVVRGFSSVSFLYSAAKSIEAEGKPAYLYYLGDRDPSGVHIDRRIEKDLRKFAPHAEIHFERVAVTVEQIEELKLPSRPTKKSDSRSKTFKGDSIEVDAIAPSELRRIVENCIVDHIDHHALHQLRRVEAAEQETLDSMIEGMGGAT